MINHDSEQARERNLLRELEILKEERDRLTERYDAAVERADSANMQNEVLERRVKQAAYVNEQLRKDLEKARSSLQARMSQLVVHEICSWLVKSANTSSRRDIGSLRLGSHPRTLCPMGCENLSACFKGGRGGGGG